MIKPNMKVILILFVGYWISVITYLIIDFSLAALLLRVVLILPLTLGIVLKKDVFSLFMICLLASFEILVSFLDAMSSLVSTEEYFKAYNIVIIIYFISIFISSVRLLKNQEKLPIRYLFVIGVSFFIVFIIREIVMLDGEYHFIDFLSIVANLFMYGLMYYYIITFPKKTLVIFK